MPTIQTASVPVTKFPNQFVSPFGNDPIVPLYSSVPLKSPVAGCLPCVVCGNSIVRSQIVSSASENGSQGFKGSKVSLAPGVAAGPATNNFLSGLFSYWQLHANGLDSVSNTNPLSMTGSPQFLQSRVGPAAYFRGTGDQSLYNNSLVLNLSAFTLSGWFVPVSDLSDWVPYSTLFTNGVVGGSYLLTYFNSGKLFAYDEQNRIWGGGWPFSGYGNKNHVAIVVTPATETYYLNAVPVGSIAYSRPGGSSTGFAVGAAYSTGKLSSNSFINKVGIWSRAWTAAEVLQMFTQELDYPQFRTLP